MKIFLIILLFSPILSLAQPPIELVDKLERTVFYDVIFVPDSTQPDKTYREPMILQVGANSSKFFSYHAFVRDSIILATGNSSIPSTIPQINIRLLKNFPDKGRFVYTDEPILFTKLKCQGVLTPVKWVIYPRMGEVLGYSCQKATTHFAGRDYVAWFTTEIPLQDAPYFFDGLPGFIIKIQDTRKHYTFEFNTIKEAHEETNIYLRKMKYTTVTWEELLNKRKEVHKRSAFSIFGDQGITIDIPGGDAEAEKRIQQNMRWLSNYIELK